MTINTEGDEKNSNRKDQSIKKSSSSIIQLQSTGTSSKGKKTSSNQPDPNPDDREGTIAEGPLPREDLFEFKKRMLLRYKELYGNMLVPQSFVVPWTDEWPEEMWRVKLGRAVNNIRNGGDHKDKREELIAIGFVFEKQAPGFQGQTALGWDRLKPALEQFKNLNGHLRVPSTFVIPSDSPDWPEEMAGIKLGRTVYNISRDSRYYREHRAEMREMGVEIKVQNKAGAEVKGNGEFNFDHQLITASGRPKHR